MTFVVGCAVDVLRDLLERKARPDAAILRDPPDREVGVATGGGSRWALRLRVPEAIAPAAVGPRCGRRFRGRRPGRSTPAISPSRADGSGQLPPVARRTRTARSSAR